MSKKKKSNYSGIGGQAVMEGIMMRNKDRYSVAVRKADGNIEIMVSDIESSKTKDAFKKIPFVRGIFQFADSLSLGMNALTYSADFFGEEEESKPSFIDKLLDKLFGSKAESVLMGFTMVLSLIFAIGIFILLPYFVSDLLKKYILNDSLVAILEGVFRLFIFIAYVSVISLMKDIKRTYMYHGAEHKCINCIERGKPLNVKNVMKSSRKHRRCGTSFLLINVVITIILFFFIRVDSVYLRVLLRLALVPVIAGISYEILALAGKSDNWFIRLISTPGIWLQSLTTKEPDEEMAEVAIKAVEAVFDWKAYLKENFEFENPSEAVDGWLDDDLSEEDYDEEDISTGNIDLGDINVDELPEEVSENAVSETK